MIRLRKRNWITLLLVIAGCMLGLAALLQPAQGHLPAFAEVRAQYRPSESWLLDRNGEIIDVSRVDYRVRRLGWISLKDISPAARELLVKSEDKQFYRHDGVDWLALSAAGVSGLLHLFDEAPRGGASTLTMQLAGYLDPSLSAAKSRRTLSQKWRQIRAARAIEGVWSKQEILEAYFNLAAFRGEIVGVHAAAYALFGVHPSALNRPQSMMLMALLKSPMANPLSVSKRACALRRSVGLDRDPTCEELQTLANSTLDLQGYQIPQAGIAPHLVRKLAAEPGSRVLTTLDANLQRYAIQSLREHLLQLDGQNVRDGAVVVIDNKSGDVLAYVGSSGVLSAAADVDGVNAPRQAGSTLKPFLYGMAIGKKWLTAASSLDDRPIQLDTGMGLYIPQNYDRDFKGVVSVRTALASSLNIPAVRTLGLVGVDSFTRTLREYGLSSLTEEGDHYGFSLALGGVDVRLIELANAYRALANGGVWQTYRFRPGDQIGPGKRLLSRQAAFIIADILSDRGARAMTFGLDNPLATRVWSAVKTGTSKDMRDNWCVGFSSRYTVGVWVGNFSGESMWDVSGVSGAAPVWRDLMNYLHANDSSSTPKPPRGIVRQAVQFIPAFEAPRKEYFLAGTETGEIHLLASDGHGTAGAHILYPTDGTVIAMDPDIPFRHQRAQFSASEEGGLNWLIDGNAIGSGAEVGWSPATGRHRLALVDNEGNELDSVTFEVRGSIMR